MYDSSKEMSSVDLRPGQAHEFGITLSNNAFEMVSFTAPDDVVITEDEVHRGIFTGKRFGTAGHDGIINRCVISQAHLLVPTLARPSSVVCLSWFPICVGRRRL